MRRSMAQACNSIESAMHPSEAAAAVVTFSGSRKKGGQKRDERLLGCVAMSRIVLSAPPAEATASTRKRKKGRNRYSGTEYARPGGKSLPALQVFNLQHTPKHGDSTTRPTRPRQPPCSSQRVVIDRSGASSTHSSDRPGTEITSYHTHIHYGTHLPKSPCTW